MKISSWPNYNDKICNSLVKILKSGKVNYWTGNENRIFENKFKNYFGIKYSLSIANGTAGLFLALKAFNLKKDSEILITPRSYYSSASTILLNGYSPKFIDIALDSQNIMLSEIKKNITNKTKAIICVHLNGYPCDMVEIMKFAKRKNLLVIEDCSQAHGAMIGNKYVGSFGDISVWSFCQDKIISTGGEGGMLGVNSFSLFKKLWALKDQGRDFNKSNKRSNNKFRYIHDHLGFNFRMTELQAKIGIIQLDYLKNWIKIRNYNSNFIISLLKKYPQFFYVDKLNNNYTHSYYRLCVRLKINKIKVSQILKQCFINKLDVYTGPCPEIYKEQTFKKILGNKLKLKNAHHLSGRTISFLVDHTISKKNMISFLKKFESIIKNITI